jgi:hypothetical protein
MLIVLRNLIPEMWNKFGHRAKKVEWIIETGEQQTGTSGSTGPLKATFKVMLHNNDNLKSRKLLLREFEKTTPGLLQLRMIKGSMKTWRGYSPVTITT